MEGITMDRERAIRIAIGLVLMSPTISLVLLAFIKTQSIIIPAVVAAVLFCIGSLLVIYYGLILNSS